MVCSPSFCSSLLSNLIDWPHPWVLTAVALRCFKPEGLSVYISVFGGAALPGPLGLLRTCNSKLYRTMTFQMIKFSMIHLAPYQTKFYRGMIEILVFAFRSTLTKYGRFTYRPSWCQSWVSPYPPWMCIDRSICVVL